MLQAIGAAVSAAAFALLSTRFPNHIPTAVAFHVAGVGMLVTAALGLAVFAYGLWHGLNRKHRAIVWDRGVGSLCFGTIGVLFALLPLEVALQKQIYLDALMLTRTIDGELHIDGAISARLRDRLQAVDEPYNRIVLDDNRGGFVFGVYDAVPYLESRGVDTVIINGQCASSCAYLALMFPKRYITSTGALGFHDLHSVTSQPELAVNTDRERVRSMLIERHYATELVDRLFKPVDIEWYQPAQALALGLVNGCWNQRSHAQIACDKTAAVSGDGSKP